jgi:hypothetical protein
MVPKVNILGQTAAAAVDIAHRHVLLASLNMAGSFMSFQMPSIPLAIKEG